MSAREIVVRLRAEIGNYVRDMRSAGDATTAAASTTRTSGQSMSTALTQTQAAAATARAGLLDAGKAAQETAKGFGLSYNSAGQLTDEFGNLVTEAHAAELGLETASEATQEFAAQTAHAAAAAEAATAQSRTGMNALLANAHANEEAWGKVGKGLLAFGAAVLVGVGLSIAKFAEFDKAMSSVDAATHETTGNMELLREKAIQVGADTAFSAVEAAQGIEELAKAGVSTKDILNGGLVGAMDLAAAGALGVGDASELAATAMTQFKLSGQEVPHIADLLAAGAGKAQGSVADLGAALKQSGLVASQVGLTIEETTGGLAAFASAGLIGSDAGTSFKSMLQRLTPQSKEAQKKMDELGISAYDAGGNFVGLEKFAGNLQTSMKDLTVEQRNTAMGVIFGSDAVRAAAVIYEQGAEGVRTWIDAVNDSGYAADTAARMKNNLAGDIEKLGGSMDTVFIKGGTGASSVLRGVVQGLEGLVDKVGQVPTPILAAGVAAAALVGGLALLAGGFVTLVPKIAATKIAMTAFATGSPTIAAGLMGIGKAAGIAAIGLFAVVGASAAFGTKSVIDVDKMTSSMQELGQSSKTADQIFGEATFAEANEFSYGADRIRGMGDALKEVTQINFGETLNRGLGEFLNGFGAKTSNRLMETTKAIEAMDQGLANMVNSGQGEEAAKAFVKITEAGKGAGVMADKTAGQFSTYQNALRKQATQLKVALTDEEVYQWALGNTPPKIAAVQASAEGQTAAAQAQQQANEEVAKALAEVGLKADGTVGSLGKLLEAMFATGLIQLSANEASIKWQESLEGLDASIAKYGTSLDITTEAGKANSRALDGMAQAGISNMEALANNGATQEQLQGTMRGTYDSLVAAAGKFGKTAEEADAYARKVLGIPDNANVDTAIQNYADSMAKLNGIKTEAEKLDGKTANVWVTTHQNSIYSEEHVSNGPGGSGGQTRWTGGLVGFAGGGIVPGTPPSNPRMDNIFAMTQNGTPYGIRSGEMIVNEPATKRNAPWLTAVNEGLNLDDVFGARSYSPPSKSLVGGYGAAMSQSAYSPGGGSAAAAPVFNVTAVVENPWTGEQVQAVVKSVAVTAANQVVNDRTAAAVSRRRGL